MTKAQLIAEVTGKSWYGGNIGGLQLKDTWPEVPANLYKSHVIILKAGNVASTGDIWFYVVKEGISGEAAFYKDFTPEEQVGITA
jgi:hypothetical protein